MKKWIVVGSIILLLMSVWILNYFNLFPKKNYHNSDFNISTYISKIDQDQDGIDDQTDILNEAKKYIQTKPKYKSKYYDTGYPNDQYGVCTDVIAFALKNAGYDLMELINQDIINHPKKYEIQNPDKNIDFRRVRNIQIYLESYAISLTTDLSKIDQWQGGDIVIFEEHIAIISDKRNSKGIPYIIHNAGRPLYEEDAILNYKIVGHYRIS